MANRGHVQNGCIVLDAPLSLPDGTLIEIVELKSVPGDSRQNWQPLATIAGKDLVDPEAYRQLRESDRAQNILAKP